MKNLKQIYSRIAIFLPILLLIGCSKDFLNRPPQDSIVDAGFYKNDNELLAATALLYNKVWFDYNDKASYNLGDFRSGTAFSAYNDRGNVLFNTTAENGENSASWRAFFIVVGQSNLAIHNINTYAGPGVSPKIKSHAIAEARFMRAVAYRFLAMNWGDVPIIENNLTLLSDTTIQRNTVKSVWKFITSEMRAVANDLPETPVAVGRISKWSAEGMLARFYLTRAGVEAVGSVRNQTFLDSAKYYSDRVIKLSGAALLPDYAKLFQFPYDNNSESLFELQWIFLPDVWGTQNSSQAYLAYSADISEGDGWGGDKSATWWMMNQYDGFVATGDTMLKGRTLDQRLKATFMLPGAYYPEITQTLNGVDQKLVFPNNTGDVSFSSIKKYVCGKAKDMGGQASSQRYSQDTYMLRLAEMYLTYTEAVLGNNTTTTDPIAIDYFNKVHTRAGLGPLSVPLTSDILFKERIVEFAMEGMGWYDLVSLHYYNPAKAYAILNSQDRGLFAVKPDVFPNPTEWTFKKTRWATTDRTIHAYDGNFLLPIPAAEMSQAPNLRKPAVDYYK
jgi:hypothetical protein